LTTGDDPWEVLDRLRSVLRSVLQLDPSADPALDEWARVLPGWFVEACSPEPTAEEAAEYLARWRRLSAPDRAALEAARPWSLGSWVYWFGEGRRQWRWWDAHVDNERSVTVMLLTEGWPCALGAFEWLARASGACTVESSPES
jgi:hypothetical protein